MKVPRSGELTYFDRDVLTHKLHAKYLVNLVFEVNSIDMRIMYAV